MMKLKKYLSITLLTVLMHAFALSSFAADVKTVTGESTFYDDGTHSRIECQRLAAEQARIDALAREFGTIVSQDILQSDRISGNREQNDFLALSSTQVKGEWLADIGEPEYTYSRDKDENLIVTCRVKGKAKAITNEAPEFTALVLRNSPMKQAAATEFRNGDYMYLYFNGASDGYLCCFLQDESGSVYMLLPSRSDVKTSVPVKKNQEYIFFSPQHSSLPASQVDELILTAPDHQEYNRMYTVYSSEPFSRPVMSTSSVGLPAMSGDEFTKWLVKAQRNDTRMGVKAMNIIIRPTAD